MQKRSNSIVHFASAAAAILSASVGMAAIYYTPVVTQVGDGGSTTLSSAGALTTIDVYANGIANQTAPVATEFLCPEHERIANLRQFYRD